MHAALRDGGVLVVTSRDWEQPQSSGSDVTVGVEPIHRHGVSCASIYLWELPERWDRPHKVKLVLVFNVPTRPVVRCHDLEFWPFSKGQLLRRMTEVGFVDLTVVGERRRTLPRDRSPSGRVRRASDRVSRPPPADLVPPQRTLAS